MKNNKALNIISIVLLVLLIILFVTCVIATIDSFFSSKTFSMLGNIPIVFGTYNLNPFKNK